MPWSALHSQSEADLRAFENRVLAWPLVRECYMLSGETDFLLKCVAPDLTAFQDFIIEELTAAPNVASVKTTLVIRRVKFEPGVPSHWRSDVRCASGARRRQLRQICSRTSIGNFETPGINRCRRIRCHWDPRGGRRVTDEFRTRMVELLPRLRRFAVALTGDLDQADDLVQETCMRALSRVEQWQPGTRLDSWMYRIAQNLWLDRMRAKQSARRAGGCRGRGGARRTRRPRCRREPPHAAGRQRGAWRTCPMSSGCSSRSCASTGCPTRKPPRSPRHPIGTVMSRLARARRELHARLEGQAQRGGPRPPIPEAGSCT